MLDTEFWLQLWGDVLSGILTWVPRLAGALLLLFIGWLVGRVIQIFISGLLRRLGMDKLAERIGVLKVLSDSGMEASAANLISRLVYWLVLLVFVIAATESLGLPGVVNTLGGLVGYLPSVLAAALIVLFGGLIARVVGEALGAFATQAGVASGSMLGQVIRYIILTIVLILALDQLGIETTLLTTAATALIGGTALALALAFGLGSRELARNIMAGFHAKDAFVEGQQIIVREFSGRLLSIGPVKTVLETESGLISLPNSALTDEEVKVIPANKETE